MGKKLTVLGPGLLGASLGMSVLERGLFESVHVWSRRPETRDKCRTLPWCTAVHDRPEKAIADAELVVICTPVKIIPDLLEKLSEDFAEGSIVTDVGSTKGSICKAAQKNLSDKVSFVGSHPMAGSEKTGLEYASADLFEGQACILTPTDETDPKATAKLEDFWSQLGMKVGKSSPAEHDRIVAAISHLPHILASILCEQLTKSNPEWKSFAGKGLRDTTRVAAGDPNLWRQILEENSTAICEALENFRGTLESFSNALEQSDFEKIEGSLAKGKTFRDSLG